MVWSSASIALCGRGLDPKLYERLRREGFFVLELPENNHCYKPVHNHPDAYVCSLMADQKWIVAPQLFDFIRTELSHFGFHEHLSALSCGSKPLGSAYPETSIYNALEIGNALLLRQKSTDAKILEFVERQNYKLWNVNQGYVRCTTLALDHENFITSDRSIEKRLLETRKNVLFIHPEGIKLEGFSHGFIGGASFILPNKVIYFYGDLSQHDQFEEILRFAAGIQYTCEWLLGRPLEDVGGVVFLKRSAITL